MKKRKEKSMIRTLKPSFIAIVLVGALAFTSAQAQQVPLPTNAAAVPGPATGNKMTTAYVQAVGRIAYIWGYAMVNSHNRRVAFSQAPQPVLVGGILPFAPVGYNAMLTNYIKPEQTFIACPNQDVVYGAGFSALDKEPTVFQVPDFGDRFWVYALYDQRTDEIAQIGKQYGTKSRRVSMLWCVPPRIWCLPSRAFSRMTPPRTPKPSSRCLTKSCSILSASLTGR
jgi:hypothetical protein